MSQNPRPAAGGYGGQDDRNGPAQRGGAPIATPAPNHGGSNGGRPPRGGTDPSTERKPLPPQYQDNYDDDYYGPSTIRPPPHHQVDPRGGVQDNRQQQQARYNDRGGYDDDDDAYDDVRRGGPADSRREGPGNPSHRGRAPGGPPSGDDYWNQQPPQRGEDPRHQQQQQQQQQQQHAAGPKTDRSRGPVPAGDGYGDNMLMTENKLLKDELDEMARHLDVLRNENNTMKDRLKREEELKKKGGDGKGGASSAEIERLHSELEKKTKQLEKLASANPKAYKDEVEAEELRAKVQSLSKENEKLKKGLPSGSQNQDVEKMSSTLKAKDKLIKEITEEKEELMAILEEDGTAEKFKQIKKKSKDLKKKNEELLQANERLEAELLKVKPDSDVLGKSTKKGCPNCEHSKKGLSPGAGADASSYKMKELPTDLRPLQELVREQESHILDLQREVDTLRHAINDYQKEIERMEAQLLDGDELGSTSRQLLLERKAALEEDSDLRREMENTRRKLRSSNRRVAQLEKWLDEIYNDKNFEIVVKGAAFKGRKTTLSLPDIGSGSPGGESTSRKGLSRKQFSTALSKSGGLDAKSSRSSFNF